MCDAADVGRPPTEEATAPLEAPRPPTRLARLSGLMADPRAPVAAIVFVLAAVGAWLLWSKGPAFPTRRAVVVFDPVRFVNSQRAAASILAARPGGNGDMALTLTQVAKQAEPVILEEAHGALILVKQAVVVPEGIHDITEAVLNRFGLPTAVPTVTVAPRLSLETLAPTDGAFSSGALREDYRMELQRKAVEAAAGAEKKTNQDAAVP